MKRNKKLCIHGSCLLYKDRNYLQIRFYFLPSIEFSYDSIDLEDGAGGMLTFAWLFWQISFWAQYNNREQ